MTTQELRVGVTEVMVVCDRCNKQIRGVVSEWYYEVDSGTWQEFARPGERIVCDECMFSDPRYKAVFYGDYSGTAVLEAGRELDVLVGKAIGFQIYHYDKGHRESNYYQLVDEEFDPVVPLFGGERKTELDAWNDTPKFSTNIADAWQIAEKFRLCVVPLGEGWTAFLPGRSLEDAARYASKTAPLAICRAALGVASDGHGSGED